MSSESAARPPTSVNDDNHNYQVVRTYVTAKDFYDKIISDKKAKDKKNRRAEQVRMQLCYALHMVTFNPFQEDKKTKDSLKW